MSPRDLKFNISEGVDHLKKEEFKVEFMNNLIDDDLYMKDSGQIDFLDENLFKVMLRFPKNISEGIYNVEIYLMEDGNLGAFQSIPIYVDKVGFSANVSKMARDKSFFYGILAILIAISASLVVNFATSLASDEE